MTEAPESPSPELEHLQREIEAIRADARLLFEGLTNSEMAWRPEPGRWSVLDCIVHLNVSAGLYVPRVDRSLAEARAKGLLGQGPPRRDWLGNWFAGVLEPPVKMRVKAPRNFQPQPGVNPEDARAEFFEWQDRIEDCVVRAAGVDLFRARVTSPALPILRFSLGQTFRIMTAHQRRHLWQARQVPRAPDCPRI